MVCRMTFQGKTADVHKTLISANVVHNKKHVASVDSNGGCIIPLQQRSCLTYSTIRSKNETVNDPGAIRLNLENGTYIGYTKIQQHVRTRSDQVLCSMHAEQKPGGSSARSVGESPMVSVVVKLTAGPPAQSPETKLQTRQEPCSSGEMMHVENEIVDAGN